MGISYPCCFACWNPLFYSRISATLNSDECCVLGAMTAAHLIESNKLTMNSTSFDFRGKTITVYGCGDPSIKQSDAIVFNTDDVLTDNEIDDHECRRRNRM